MSPEEDEEITEEVTKIMCPRCNGNDHQRVDASDGIERALCTCGFLFEVRKKQVSLEHLKKTIIPQ